MGLRIYKLLLGLCAVIGVECSLRAATNEVSIFLDRNLENAVRDQVFAKRGTNSPLTAMDVATVSTVVGRGRGITNLTGLEHCTALALLDLSGNKITDLSPLADLKQLQSATFTSNQIGDVGPLARINALQYLELSHNQVKDTAPLATLSHLSSLYLQDNRLTTLGPVTNLTRLTTLYVDGNKLKSLAGLEKIPRLGMLSAAHNSIEDITPVAALTEPTFLILAHNRIKDVAPLYKALTNDLAGNQRFAPFVRIYLQENPLKRAAKKDLADLAKRGVKIDPDPIP
ncbi:MAG TPA: leucine-rich repeat domain-containing protein [Candidatus Limnocylindria bacterium]|jgi:Leucine-rich repeat (LRR) protein|nr:leucine-rich repeat domain-containing protein [Candidatus Limnocylindria bacterium]